jgi:hypothetical protein
MAEREQNFNLPQIEIKPLRERLALPLLLRHPKILGKVEMICGRK